MAKQSRSALGVRCGTAVMVRDRSAKEEATLSYSIYLWRDSCVERERETQEREEKGYGVP